MGRFEPPDLTQGDPNTVGGYRAAHGRPPAFEGSDGAAYSVEIVADAPDATRAQFAAYLLFVRWRSDDPVALGHAESEYLAFAETEERALASLASMPLQTAREHLEQALLRRAGADQRSGNGERR